MSAKYTEIETPNGAAGVGYPAHVDRAFMIADLRRHADHMRRQVAEIDATADEDFVVVQMMGPLARRNKRELPHEGA